MAAQLAKNKRVVVYGIPGEKKIPAAPPTPPAVEKTVQQIEAKEPWRKATPAPSVASTTALPKAQTMKLGGTFAGIGVSGALVKGVGPG